MSLRHDALFYADDDAYLDGVLGFVDDARDDDRPVLLALPSPRVDLVAPHLRGAEGVRLVDASEASRNPARIIPAVQAFVDEYAGGPVSVVGEPMWPGRSPAEVAEVTRHEALVESAFGAAPMDVLCPYDVARLDPRVTSDARRTHHGLVQDGVHRPSPQFAPQDVLGEPHELGPLPADASRTRFDMTTLGRLRDAVRTRATAAGLSAVRVEDLLLAVSEVAANSVQHGGGTGTAAVWADAEMLVCEVRDGGELGGDPLVGRRLPGPASTGGRGLWLAHQVGDLVEVRSTTTGTVVRLTFLL